MGTVSNVPSKAVSNVPPPKLLLSLLFFSFPSSAPQWRKHSANHVLTFKDYEAFSEKVGIFRRNLYKFGDIFGDSSETFGDGSDQPSLLESRGQEVIQRP